MYFNKGERKGDAGRTGILVKSVFGSKEAEGRGYRIFNQNYVWFTRGGERFENQFTF